MEIDFSQMPKGNVVLVDLDIAKTTPQYLWMEEQLKLVDINEYLKQLNEYHISTLNKK